MYEHKFIKLKAVSFGLPNEDYREIVYEHEKEGWELVQIFAPSTSQQGRAKFFELIFKRMIDESKAPRS